MVRNRPRPSHLRHDLLNLSRPAWNFPDPPQLSHFSPSTASKHGTHFAETVPLLLQDRWIDFGIDFPDPETNLMILKSTRHVCLPSMISVAAAVSENRSTLAAEIARTFPFTLAEPSARTWYCCSRATLDAESSGKNSFALLCFDVHSTEADAEVFGLDCSMDFKSITNSCCWWTTLNLSLVGTCPRPRAACPFGQLLLLQRQLARSP